MDLLLRPTENTMLTKYFIWNIEVGYNKYLKWNSIVKTVDVNPLKTCYNARDDTIMTESGVKSTWQCHDMNHDSHMNDSNLLPLFKPGCHQLSDKESLWIWLKIFSIQQTTEFVTLLFFAVVYTGVIAADISEIIADNLFAVIAVLERAELLDDGGNDWWALTRSGRFIWLSRWGGVRGQHHFT